jgi:hypothetical protein
MNYTQILILLLVFLSAVLLHLLISRKEAFQNIRTPLTKENVQSLADEIVLDILANYQKYKNDTKTKDKRVQLRLVDIGYFINLLNDQYPAVQYFIESFDYKKYPSIALEDLQLIKQIITYNVGIISESKINAPADIADIDLVSNRIKSFIGILQQKAIMVQGAAQLMTDFNNSSRLALENLKKLKLNMPNLKPEDIPLLKADMYYYAFIRASSNFVIDPSLDMLNVPELRLDNLPAAKSATAAIVAAIAPKVVPQPTVAPATVAQPSIVAPTAAPTQPKTPTGLKFSELVQTLMAYAPIQEAQQKPSTASTATTASTEASGETRSALTKTAAPIDEIKSTIRDEIQAQLKGVKLGPKDLTNEDISKRSTEPVPPTAPKANSDALQQGSWFRSATDQGCPYADGQQAGKPVPFPIDMNDYIRKDKIPCWGCTLK